MQIYVVSDDDSGWFDLGTDPDELKQEISDQLGTDDWKIDDSDPQIDNIGRLTLEDLCEIAEIVDISAFVAWLNYTDDFDYVKDHFDEAYHGHYDTPSEFAEAYITGIHGIPDYILVYIDWERVAADLEMDHYFVDADPGIYVFRQL
jgi:antirestriction protein